MQVTCDRVIIINKGTLVEDGPTQEVITRTQGGQLLQVAYAPGKVAPTQDAVRDFILAIDGVERASPQKDAVAGQLAYEVLARRDVRAELFQLAVDQGLVLLELARERTGIEEIFRRLTVARDGSEAATATDADADAGAAG